MSNANPGDTVKMMSKLKAMFPIGGAPSVAMPVAVPVVVQAPMMNIGSFPPPFAYPQTPSVPERPNPEIWAMRRAQAVQAAAVTSAAEAAEAAYADLHHQEADQDEMVAEDISYAVYKPRFVDEALGAVMHPDPVVENASLAAVDPPFIHYESMLPEDTIRLGLVSSLQLESVLYAGQKHLEILPNGYTAGFFIGDGAGVGKGRQIAAVILDNWMHGRKRHLWVSVSRDLANDAKRDLSDIGAGHINVFQLPTKFTRITEKKGVLFVTYASLIGKMTSGQHTRLQQILQWLNGGRTENVENLPPSDVLVDMSTLPGVSPDRMRFGGVIAFDEAHKAKNLFPPKGSKPTKTGEAVQELCKQLSGGRVLYCSATGASDPTHFGFMDRLGLWGKGTPFPGGFKGHSGTFLGDLATRGIGGMELVAAHLKMMGAYLARELAFSNCTFELVEVELDEIEIELYNSVAELLRDLWVDASPLLSLQAKRQFWGGHQRIFRDLCSSFKVKGAVEVGQNALDNGDCVVIGLQSTGEAGMELALGDDKTAQVDDAISAPRTNLIRLVELCYGASVADHDDDDSSIGDFIADSGDSSESSMTESSSSSDAQSSSDEPITRRRPAAATPAPTVDAYSSDDKPIQRPTKRSKVESPSAKKTSSSAADPNESVRQAWMNRIGDLDLPGNPLDMLIDSFQGPRYVAELTGRKGRMMRSKNGTWSYQKRCGQGVTQAQVNMREKEAFMDGKKVVAIISEAASSGISLQADRRVRNQRQRVHITIELAWSADKAVQQLGRSHRSNQVTAPDYKLLISPVGGERRFAAAVAKRLETMGALIHGDRRAQHGTATSGMSAFNLESVYGQRALTMIIADVYTCIDGSHPTRCVRLVNIPDLTLEDATEVHAGLLESGRIPTSFLPEDVDFFMACWLYLSAVDFPLDPTKPATVARFLNRMLGLAVDTQHLIFSFFIALVDALIREDKRLGKYKQGITEVTGRRVLFDDEVFGIEVRPATSSCPALLYSRGKADRGISMEMASNALEQAEQAEGGKAKVDGFYRSKRKQVDGQYGYLLAVSKHNARALGSGAHDKCALLVRKPSTGISDDTLSRLHNNWVRATNMADVREWWNREYTLSEYPDRFRGRAPEFMCRMQSVHILHGGVLGSWEEISSAMGKHDASGSRLPIVRCLEVDDDHEIAKPRQALGIRVPYNSIDNVLKRLREPKPDPIIAAAYAAQQYYNPSLYQLAASSIQ